jgi:prepilin-type processing-associated H-X9-DG protein
MRYFAANDPYGHFPGNYGNTRPVHLHVGSGVYRNIDPPADTRWPHQGNLRFRHDGNTTCNVGMSDGSVRQFRATVGTNNSVTGHDAIRRLFMIHYPPGVTPNLAHPH